MSTKILIVEDERITAEYIHDTLVQLVIRLLESPPRRVTRSVRPEQIQAGSRLMDIRIKGDTDGIETAKTLRQRFDIPVVYLTAHADIETLQRAKDAEPLGYIVKPFQEPEAAGDDRSRTAQASYGSPGGGKKGAGSWPRSKAIGEGVITVDADERILLMNPAAEAWTGWKTA
jgi:CheY-like chemotaxis protein